MQITDSLYHRITPAYPADNRHPNLPKTSARLLTAHPARLVCPAELSAGRWYT